MEERVIVERDQQVTDTDIDDISLNAQISLDRVVREAIDDEPKYSGFAVVSPATAELTVGQGAIWRDGKVYVNLDEGGTEISLLANLPVAARRIVSIIGYGQEVDARVEPRTFLLDAVTRTTEARAVPTRRLRRATIDKVVGAESSTPTPPAIDSNYVEIARVLISSAGILSITMMDENRLQSVADNYDILLALSLWKEQATSTIETLKTQLALLNERIKGMTPAEFSYQLATDVARVKDLVGVPDNYTAYGADYFLTTAESDTANVDWLALVEEGVRFGPTAIHDAQLTLLNADDVAVVVTGNMALPANTDVLRISIVGADSELSISQYAFQTTALVQKTVSRSRVRYGTTMSVCTNGAWWQSGRYDPARNIFYIGGETWTTELTDGNRAGHMWFRVTQFWTDTWDEPYWEAITVESSVGGAVVGQTFLNSETTWLKAIGLYFTRKGLANVQVVLCEVDSNGVPNISKVVQQVTLAVDSVLVGGAITKVPFPPTLLVGGRRYAVVLISSGAHYVGMVHGNKFAQGSFFYSTDGAWAVSDLTKDMSFQLYVAKFNGTRVELQLNPLELGGGMADLDITADTIAPAATSIVYEVKVDNVWRPISGAEMDLLIGLPPLLQLRAVLTGTVDLMPALGVNARSRTRVTRPRADFQHISTAMTTPANVDRVVVTCRVEAWDAAHHTLTMKVLRGAGFTTVETADSTQVIDTEDPFAKLIRSVFDLAVPVSTFKIRLDGHTDNVLLTYHVAYRAHVATDEP